MHISVGCYTNWSNRTISHNEAHQSQTPAKSAWSTGQISPSKSISNRSSKCKQNSFDSFFNSQYKVAKTNQAVADVAARHGLATAALQDFVDSILRRMVFDGDQLSELFAPQGLGWKARTQKELALMEDLIPLLHKLAQGREISGLGAYEQ